jgi:hypothetical protein
LIALSIFGAVPPSVNHELLRLRPKNVPVIADVTTMIRTVAMWKFGLIRFSPIKHDVVGFYIDDRTTGAVTGIFYFFHFFSL